MTRQMILALAGLSLVTAHAAPVTIRFQQWNIGHFSHGAKPTPSADYSHAEKWLAALKEADADVVGFAEYGDRLGDEAATPATNAFRSSGFSNFHVGSSCGYNWNAFRATCETARAADLWYNLKLASLGR